MRDLIEGMPFASSLGFSITTRCPIACPHCIIEAGPRRTEEMLVEDACDWMHQAAAYREGYITSVVFTGGEPFFNRALLGRLLYCAVSLGLVPAAVTNAYWASSPERAIETLSSLPQIRMLSISADVYHQRAIPLENIRNAVLAARELGVRYNLAVCFESETDPEFLQLKNNLEEFVEDSLIRLSAVFPAGRARKTFKPQKQVFLDEPVSGPCLGADFATVFPDGRVIGCMALLAELPPGHPLYLGSLKRQSLAQILDAAETNVPLHMMRVWGPSKLVELLEAAGFKHRLPKKYIRHGYCDLCYAMLADAELTAALVRLTDDVELAEHTAYARKYFLEEEEMIRLLKEMEPRGAD